MNCCTMQAALSMVTWVLASQWSPKLRGAAVALLLTASAQAVCTFRNFFIAPQLVTTINALIYLLVALFPGQPTSASSMKAD